MTISVGFSVGFFWLFALPWYVFMSLAAFRLKQTVIMTFAGVTLMRVNAGLVQLCSAAQSRATEYKVDALASLDIGTPEPLISGLDALGEAIKHEDPEWKERNGNPLTRSHPTNSQRAKALRAMSTVPVRERKKKDSSKPDAEQSTSEAPPVDPESAPGSEG